MILNQKYIKKRTVIAILITLVTLILLNKYWLIFKPMPVSMDIEGNGPCHLEVLLNKVSSDDFKNSKSASTFYNSKEKTNITLLVHRSRQPKRLRITLTNCKSSSPIILGNINLKQGKSKLKLNKFKTEGAITKIENEKLILKPISQTIRLNYTEEININASVKFDFLIFTIITILAYLIAYKLTDYLADFSTLKNKSRIDLIFIIIFFISLIMPALKISDDKYSARENRTLAEWKPLFMGNHEINYDFGKNFNDWFNDRFNFRDSFVGLFNFIVFEKGKNFDKGLFDSNTGFMYKINELKYLDENHVKEIFNILNQFDSWCKKHNIELYVLITPPKPKIYETNNSPILEHNKHRDFLNLIQDTKLSIAYPYKEMYHAKKDNFMFFKTEHHWTDDGAFIGYQVLMRLITKNHPDIKILNAKDFNYSYNNLVRGDFNRKYGHGSTIARLGLSNPAKYHDVNYRYYTHKDSRSLKQEIISQKYHLGKIFHYPQGANYRVIQLGTSQNENLTEFIPYTFRYVKRIRNNSVYGFSPEEQFKIMRYYEQEILEYKPDIIIFCITYDNIPDLENFFK